MAHLLPNTLSWGRCAGCRQRALGARGPLGSGLGAIKRAPGTTDGPGGRARTRWLDPRATRFRAVPKPGRAAQSPPPAMHLSNAPGPDGVCCPLPLCVAVTPARPRRVRRPSDRSQSSPICAAGHPIVNRGMWGGMRALPRCRDPDSNQGHRGRADADARTTGRRGQLLSPRHVRPTAIVLVGDRRSGRRTRSAPRRPNTRGAVMTVRSPHAGTRPDASMLIDVDSLLAAYHDLSPDPADSVQRVAFGTSGHRGSATAGTFNEAHMLAITEAICRTARRGASTARSSSAATPTRFRSPRGSRRSRSSRPTGSTSASTRGRRAHADAGVSHAILTHNRGRRRRGGRRHRDHAVAQPARGRRVQVQPADGGPADSERHHAGLRTGEPVARGRPRRRARIRTSGRPRASTSVAYDYVGVYVAELVRSSTWSRCGAGYGSAWTRSAGRASVLGGLAERYGLDLDRGEPTVDPDVPVHAARPGRQDPHGLLLAVTRWRALIELRALRRRRSASTRTPTGTGSSRAARAHEPQPLSRRGDRVPVRHRPRLAGGRRRRQDDRHQQHDRPRRQRARPAPGRGPCRFSGSSTGCSTARSGSAGRRAPARRSFARDGCAGPRTRTASCSRCSPPR